MIEISGILTVSKIPVSKYLKTLRCSTDLEKLGGISSFKEFQLSQKVKEILKLLDISKHFADWNDNQRSQEFQTFKRIFKVSPRTDDTQIRLLIHVQFILF